MGSKENLGIPVEESAIKTELVAMQLILLTLIMFKGVETIYFQMSNTVFLKQLLTIGKTESKVIRFQQRDMETYGNAVINARTDLELQQDNTQQLYMSFTAGSPLHCIDTRQIQSRN